MALFSYMKQVQRLVRDQNMVYLNPEDIIDNINLSRRLVAMRTQSVRILSPTSGPLATANVTAPGSGYVNPIATVSPPDYPSGIGPDFAGAQATATATQVGGQISSVAITYGGAGYFQPTITITDGVDGLGPGTGATVAAVTTAITTTQNGQEVYNFSDIPLTNFPGVSEVIAVNSIAVIFEQFRYATLFYSFSTYQALIRNFPLQYRYVPAVAAQFGQGANGSLYLYPVASAPYQLELDCYCNPQDLIDDQSVEAVPQPWRDVVVYHAAHLCFLELQNLNAANYYAQLAETRLSTYSAAVRQHRTSNRYGRWAWLPFMLPSAVHALQILLGSVL